MSQDLIEYGFAQTPLAGEKISGDLFVMKPNDGKILIAVMDGLGHGQEAAGASDAAAMTISGSEDASLLEVVTRCHERLRGSRGIVLNIASVNSADNSISWISIGNVFGVILRNAGNGDPGRQWMISKPGVVGYQLPKLTESKLPLIKGDVIIFATDGISDRCLESFNMSGSPQAMADQICSSCNKGTDDALVVVMKYLGAES